MDHRRHIQDTDKARNLEIAVDGSLSVDQMEVALRAVAATSGLVISHITTLGAKKYPGNRHWHFKQDLKSKGCLDITYWRNGPLMWVTMRNYEPTWVHEQGEAIGPELLRYLKQRSVNLTR